MKASRPNRAWAKTFPALALFLALALPASADVAETLERIYADQGLQTELPQMPLDEARPPVSIPSGRPLVGIAIVVACVVALLIAWASTADWERLRERLPVLRKHRAKAADADGERLPDWFLQADELAAEGCHAEAVHALLLGVLAFLGSGDRRWPAAATAREIARRLRSDDLRALVAAAELAHFRGQPASVDDYRRCRTRAVHLREGALPVAPSP